MAARDFGQFTGTYGRGLVEICGSFAPNGAGAIDNTANAGKGFSVTRSGAGTYLVALDDPFFAYETAIVTLQLSAADDKMLQVTGALGQTFTITCWDISGAAAADIAANANNRVNFRCVVKNSSAYG